MAEAKDEVIEVLNRSKAIPEGVTPMGRKIGLIPVPLTSFTRLGYIDGKGGLLPQEMQSNYTSIRYAQNSLNEYLKRLWDISDNAKTKKPLNAVSK